MFKFIKKNIFFIAITVFLIFLRFYRATDFFSFNFDEEYQAHLALEQVKNFHVIWIGVNASNIGFYLGPGFTYLNALLFRLTNGGLESIAYFAPFVGVLTAGSLYFITKEIFNRRVAILAMLFYLGSALTNFYDRRFWNPLPVSFITIWLFYSLYRAQKDARYFILTAVLLATSLHVHLSLLVFWPLVLFYLFQNRHQISLKTWLISVGLYLLIVSPLIVFDFVHNFDNLTMPLRYLQNIGTTQASMSLATMKYHFMIWFNSLGRYWFIKPITDLQNEQCLGQQCQITPANLWLGILSLSSFFYLLFKALKNQKTRFLLLFTVFSFGFLIIYPGQSAEYYLLSFFVLFPIVLALFWEKKPVWLAGIVVLTFVLFNSLTIINSTQARFGLNTRKKGVERVMTFIENKPYDLENYGTDPRKYHSYGGWRYLFRVYGNKPTHAFADEFFGWIYPDEMVEEKSVYRVVISEDIPYQSPEKAVLKFKEGAYYFYVFPY